MNGLLIVGQRYKRTLGTGQKTFNFSCSTPEILDGKMPHSCIIIKTHYQELLFP